MPCILTLLSLSSCRRVGRLQAGQYFGELACWTGARRSASVVSITPCELYRLQRSALKELARQWPEITAELHVMGALVVPSCRFQFASLEELIVGEWLLEGSQRN
jgi:CRP-like cAMP-binding protein